MNIRNNSELLFGDLIPLARYPFKECYYINVSKPWKMGGS